MPKYEVTLKENIKANKQEYKAGVQLTVDAELYAELEVHNIITNVREIEGEIVVDLSNETQLVEKLTELPDYKRIKTDEIKTQLALYNVTFEKNDKSELYELLKAAIESGE